ncbi:3-ketoacyl-CoA thiolase, mitochondrial [Araneus ventricosus]|uniref:3-ketoacyl-CoA thiolase, mitochondrial n=1 Tax=Araneus ventricosus TaxID=182803 RepID=A0A4Y2AJJ2_ARAVE|nr:3-ketoacyl-CoA thiolase, mitochondrial [Araneus ventricosus]
MHKEIGVLIYPIQNSKSKAMEICLREAEVVLAGGAENMSQSPYAVRDIRFGTKFGVDLKLEDMLWSSVYDTYADMPMAITAENLAEKYKISREECDSFALQSQLKWKNAHDNGRFQEEMAPVPVKVKGKEVMFEVDEHPRPQSTMEGLTKLKPVFKPGGTVTAGNASGICDGAAAVVLASEDYVKANKLAPLARIVGYSYVVFIFDDFNLHHPLWGATTSLIGFKTQASSLPTQQFPHSPITTERTLLDLTICSASIFHPIDCSVADSTFESDHNPVITTWSVLNNNPKNIKTINWNRVMQQSAEILTSTNCHNNNLIQKISNTIKENTTYYSSR